MNAENCTDLNPNDENFLCANGLAARAGLEDFAQADLAPADLASADPTSADLAPAETSAVDTCRPEEEWFVMRDLTRPNARERAWQYLPELGFQTFTPMHTVIEDVGGRRVRRSVPFISDMLFVRSTRGRLDSVVDRRDTLQYRFVKGGGYCRPLTVPTVEMERFIAAVGATDDVRYLRADELTPAMIGSRVRMVCDNVLNEFEGHLLAIRGTRKKRLIIRLAGLLTATIPVSPSDYVALL